MHVFAVFSQTLSLDVVYSCRIPVCGPEFLPWKEVEYFW